MLRKIRREKQGLAEREEMVMVKGGGAGSRREPEKTDKKAD